MGKWKHKKVANVGRNQPLAKQIEEATYAQESNKPRKEKNVIESEKFVGGKLGKKILDEARRQQEDLMEEHGLVSKVTLEESLACVEMGNINLQDEEGGDQSGEMLSKESDEQEALYSDLKISEDDEKALELFMNKEQTERKTLADYIQEKLKEKETEVHTQFSDVGSVKFQDLDDKIIELYKGVRIVLSRYRSGKIPKAFKVIPALANWEQILALTDPNKWTSAAMLQATRLFTANLKEKMAQRFFNLILLPRIRDEIAEYKRLNVHMYQCLKKALFKPGAFYKGIVLPLCQGGDCTLREAVIISSVLAKTSVPLLHSCAAMLKIAEMDYSGANSIFLHTLLKKKYALPYRVIDALVSHFIRFVADKRELPVLWHQSLLAFVENYQDDISDEQKEALADLCKTHRHHAITPVILNHLHPSMANVEKMITS